MNKPTIRTRYMSKSKGKALHLEQYPNAGPYANIIGMKKQYWGMDSYVVKCGVYIYKVPYEIWSMAETY